LRLNVAASLPVYNYWTGSSKQ